MVPEMLRLPQDQIEQRKAAFQGNNKLEYGNFGDLPDDDPATRDGGLDPSNKDDWHQLQLLVGQRQSGMLSDKAWQRVMQRNPKTSTLLSSMTSKPEKDEKMIWSEKVTRGAAGLGDPLGVSDELRMRLGRNPSKDEIKSFYKQEVVPTAFAPVVAQGTYGPEFYPRGLVPPRVPNLKELPSSVNTALLNNETQIEKLKDLTIALDPNASKSQRARLKEKGIQHDPSATGLKGYLPNSILNRVDPSGVDVRAIIADLGSMKIHDRSGAAVTASEFPRLRPFIPSETDDDATVLKKVRGFYREAMIIQRELQSQYSPDQGYIGTPQKKNQEVPEDSVQEWERGPDGKPVRKK